MQLKTWYFAANVHGMRHAFDQIMAAVLSCRANTALALRCLYDDAGGDETTERRAQWLAEHGVTVIRRKASMVDLLKPQFGEDMEIFGGHWLRCDIPEVEQHEDVVLYTDIDVIFMRSLPDIEPPETVACAPEHHRDDYSYFNSGVMIMNLPAFRRRRAAFVEIVRRRLSSMAPHDDQGALNELFAGEWTQLPPIWNWKPYWGEEPDAILLHFHGPKAWHAVRMQAGALDMFGDSFETIYKRSPAGYAHYTPLFHDLIAGETV